MTDKAQLPTQYQEFIHKSRYARWSADKKRRETWSETVSRYLDFWKDHYPSVMTPELYDELFNSIFALKTMPSMRALMTAGKALEKDNVAGFNCSYTAIDNPKKFDEILYILTCGSGVGFSVERQFVAKLPAVAEEFFPSETVIKVPDSKIGWASSFRELISLLYAGKIPTWDTSSVRPAGAILKTFGGRASGPQPLDDLFKFTVNLFKNAAGRKLTSLECHDLVCKVAEIVVVGGVRRSALISLSNLSDDRMRSAKNGAWWEENVQRALANNSAAYTEKPDIGIFMREWLSLYESKSGERGIFNREAAKKLIPERRKKFEYEDYGTNPSLRKGTKVWTDEGIFPIEDLVGKRFNVRNLNGELSNATCWLSGKNKPLYKVLLEGGHYYYATAEHKWPVINEQNDSIKKVETSKLRAGHVLPISSGGYLTHGTEGTIDEGFLLGWIYSLGWILTSPVMKSGMFVPNTREHLLPKLKNILVDLGVNVDLSYNSVKKGYDVFFEDKLNDLFSKFGITSFEDGLPKSIWTYASENFRKGFVDGLFSSVIGGDGGKITYSSPYKNVIRDLTDMFGFYGIKNHISGEVALDEDEDITTRYQKRFNNSTIQIKDGATGNFNLLFPLTEVGLQKRFSNSKFMMPEMLEDASKIKVVEVKLTKLEEDVWDVRVDDETHCFNLSHCVTGNCSEIILRSGQMCNLSEVIIRPDDTLDTLKEKVKNAAILGTFQATMTNFRYLTREWKKNTEEEALLGVSFTGIMDHEVMNGNSGKEILEQWLSELKVIAQDVNIQYAEKLGINPSAAITCVKPSGCGSLDTRISTTKGIISFRDLFKINGVDLTAVDQGTWIEPSIEIYVHDINGDEQKITKLYVNGVADLYEISDKNGIKYKFTGDHQIWVNDDWAKMIDLYKNKDYTVRKVSPEITVDIEVENTHTYLLSNGWAVHNTVSQLVDSASGIHPRYSPYYIRTVRADVKDPLSKFLKDLGFVCEPDITKPDSTIVFSFPMKSPEGSVFRDDKTAIEQLELWKTYQVTWCEHKPSVTIYVKEDEWMEVGAWVYKNFDILSGVSFLPHSNHSYKQAPYQECTKEEYEALKSKYENLVIDWDMLSEYEKEDHTTSAKELACVAGVCEI